MNNTKMVSLALVLFSCILFLPHHAGAAATIEWNLKKQLNLEAPAQDVASSPDGKWMYILTRGQLLVYSVEDEKTVNRIPLDKTFDRVSHSAPNNTLIISSSTEKTVKLIQLEFVQNFSLDGLPFRGPRNAAVTLVVFSDYQ